MGEKLKPDALAEWESDFKSVQERLNQPIDQPGT